MHVYFRLWFRKHASRQAQADRLKEGLEAAGLAPAMQCKQV